MRIPKSRNSKTHTTPFGSRVVPHPSTKKAQRDLTSQIGRDAVHYSWYGRVRKLYERPTLTYVRVVPEYVDMGSVNRQPLVELAAQPLRTRRGPHPWPSRGWLRLGCGRGKSWAT